MRNRENTWEAYFRRRSYKMGRYQILFVFLIVALWVLAMLLNIKSHNDPSERCDGIYELIARPVYGEVVKKTRRNSKARVDNIVVRDFNTNVLAYFYSERLDSASSIGDTLLKAANSTSAYLFKDGKRLLMIVTPWDPACPQWWREHNPDRARLVDSLDAIERAQGLRN
jgi:hypothetical protein